MTASGLHLITCRDCGTSWESGDWVNHPQDSECHKCNSHNVSMICPTRVGLTRGPIENVCPAYAENIGGMLLFKGKVRNRLRHQNRSARGGRRGLNEERLDSELLLDFSMFDEEGNYR